MKGVRHQKSDKVSKPPGQSPSAAASAVIEQAEESGPATAANPPGVLLLAQGNAQPTGQSNGVHPCLQCKCCLLQAPCAACLGVRNYNPQLHSLTSTMLTVCVDASLGPKLGAFSAVCCIWAACLISCPCHEHSYYLTAARAYRRILCVHMRQRQTAHTF